MSRRVSSPDDRWLCVLAGAWGTGLAIVTLFLALGWYGRTFPGFVVLANAHVDSLASYRWSGFQGQDRLRQLDRVIALDGHPVHDAREITERVRSVQPGIPLRVTVQRTGKAPGPPITVRSQRFGTLDWCAYFLAFWCVGVGHLLLGLLVSWKRPGDATARAHLVFCTTYGTFFLTNFDSISTCVFSRFPHNLAFSLLAASAWALAARVPRRWNWMQGGLERGVWGGAFALAVFVAWSFEHPAAWPAGFTWLTLTSEVATLLIPLTATCAMVSRTSAPGERAQGKWIGIGALAAYVPPIAVNSLALAGTTVPYGELTYLAFIVFPATVAATIVRHQLFGIRRLLRRTLGYALVTAALAAIHAIVTSWAGARFGTARSGLVATVVLVGMFEPLRRRVQAVIERWFDRSPYDPDTVVARFEEDTRRLWQPGSLHEALLRRLEDVLAPRWCVLSDATEQVLARRGEFPCPTRDGVGARLKPGRDEETLEVRLAAGSPVEGTVLLGPRRSDLPYEPREQSLIRQLGSLWSLRVQNARLVGELADQARLRQELAIARDVQAGLLPRALPDVPGLELAAITRSALEVGGDFHDAIVREDGTTMVIVGDVAGKGVPAALVMAIAVVLFRRLARSGHGAAGVLDAMNEDLCRHRPSARLFVTAVVARLDPDTGGAEVASAGHPAPRTPAGPIPARGPALGVFPGARYSATRANLAPGEPLLLFSDGLEDARDGEDRPFGEGAIAAMMAELPPAPASLLLMQILKRIEDFQGSREAPDDLTLLVVRRPP